MWVSQASARRTHTHSPPKASLTAATIFLSLLPFSVFVLQLSFFLCMQNFNPFIIILFYYFPFNKTVVGNLRIFLFNFLQRRTDLSISRQNFKNPPISCQIIKTHQFLAKILKSTNFPPKSRNPPISRQNLKPRQFPAKI